MKITKKTITAAIAFIAMQCAWGQATGTWNLPSKNINGLNYLLCNDTEIFEDTEGVMLDNLNCWEGELELPPSVNWDGKDYPLAYISSAGFVWCETLTRISIPETVRDVLFYAIWYGNQMLYKSPFVGCVNLEAIEVHEDNPWLCSEDGVLFNKEKTQLYNYPPGSKRSHYDIPEGVQAIGSQAFAYNTSLTTVTIPNTVNRICYAAFQGSESLEQVIFSDEGITTIEELTFQGCGKLRSIVLPESLTTLGEKVFMSCSSLKKIDLPQSVRGISSTAFLSCSLDTLIIRGHIDNINNGFLTCLSESTKLYVPTSETDRYREVFAGEVLPLERLEEPRQPLAFLEGNPIWVYKYEHISQARVPLISYWLDTGNRRFTYYFLGKQKEIDGKVYTMMGEVISRGEDELTVNHWLPVREENGVVYAFTDSLPGVTNEYYDWRYNDEQPMSYLQQGNECVLYDFSMGIGERLSLPGGPNITVESYGTYQLMDGTECRVLKTTWEYVDLYERLGYVNLTQDFGIMDPFLSMPLPTNGDVFESRLNAFFGDYVMLYKAPDVQEGLCVNDTIWTREDAEAYAPAYRADPRQEEVFSYIRHLQSATTGDVTIDGLNYYLYSSSHEATLKGGTWTGELDIPAEVSYNGQAYTVKDIVYSAFRNCKDLTKVRIPKTIEKVLNYYPTDDEITGMVSPDHMNPFMGCTALESIEVDEENPSLKSVDGVLFSQDGKGYYYYLTNSYYGTGLYCYPAGARRESYTIPDGVEWIGSGAFEHNQYISTLTIPSSMKMIYYSVFSGCSNLKNVYCYAEDVPIAFSEAFKGFPVASATLHVPAGSVDKYKAASPWSEFGNIVALPVVTYTAGQMATIILPTEPDASKGKYYRLDRCEDGQIIFVQELQPQAHIPYIIVPSEDFSIDTSTLDLAGLSNDTVSIGGISFIGSYSSETLNEPEGFYIDIIDTTPDCSLSLSGETGKVAHIGALRAYLQVSWDEPYNHGGSKAPGEKLGILLKDYGTGIGDAKRLNDKGQMINDNYIYDLSGRKISGKPARGVYIKDGKKVAIK